LSYNNTEEENGVFLKTMRPGPLEIVLIIVIITAAAVIARIARGGKRPAAPSTPDAPAEKYENRTDKIRAYFNRTGIALVIIGILALLAAASFFRWVLQSYLWSTILIAVGLLLVFLSRKKR
jgi:hypothetical protein